MSLTRLEIDSTGRVRGNVSISYNQPWPCANGYRAGFKSPARGVVLHTEQGSEQGTIEWFNNPASQASAWFAVGLDGAIWQFAPVGSGWCSWAQSQGNETFYSIEDADNGDPSTPFTAAQVQSIALLVEVLSRHDGFPLAVASDPFTERGVTLHSEGGQAFGGHLQCPGSVRGAQRPRIIALAMAIRSGTSPVPAWQEAIMNALPTLQQGSVDKPGSVFFVRRMQALIKAVGEINGLALAAGQELTGTFDAATKAALEQVQASRKLTVDGVCGAQSWGVLVAGSAT